MKQLPTANLSHAINAFRAILSTVCRVLNTKSWKLEQRQSTVSVANHTIPVLIFLTLIGTAAPHTQTSCSLFICVLSKRISVATWPTSSLTLLATLSTSRLHSLQEKCALTQSMPSAVSPPLNHLVLVSMVSTSYLLNMMTQVTCKQLGNFREMPHLSPKKQATWTTQNGWIITTTA